jgi:hypothetical protein
MAFLAYQREIEVRTRVDRRMTQFRARQREWARSAKDRGREVSAKLLQAIERVAPAELEQIVRKRTPLAIDQLSDADFEVLAAQWLGRKGLTIALDGDVGSPAFESRIQSWLEAQNASIALSK